MHCFRGTLNPARSIFSVSVHVCVLMRFLERERVRESEEETLTLSLQVWFLDPTLHWSLVILVSPSDVLRSLYFKFSSFIRPLTNGGKPTDAPPTWEKMHTCSNTLKFAPYYCTSINKVTGSSFLLTFHTIFFPELQLQVLYVKWWVFEPWNV